MSEKNELMTLEARNLELSRNYERQVELFAKFGYPNPGPHLLGHNMVVETADGKYKLVKRERPVDFEFDNDGNSRCVVQMQKTKVERLGGMRVEDLSNRDTAKAVVENVLCQSVEPGEVASWGTL